MCTVSKIARRCKGVVCNNAILPIDTYFNIDDVLQGQTYCLHEILNEDIFRQVNVPYSFAWVMYLYRSAESIRNVCCQSQACPASLAEVHTCTVH